MTHAGDATRPDVPAGDAPRASTHASFTIERTIKASPARVFRSFSDAETKATWFGGSPSQWTPLIREMDFRVGGKERMKVTWNNGKTSDFQCTYFDIVDGERIIYVYDMYVDDRKLSVSLATIEVLPDGDATRLVVTEQGVFFDGGDDAINRERGTQGLMDGLVKSVEGNV